MFTVLTLENAEVPPIVEANRIFIDAMTFLVSHFCLSEMPRPKFTLVMGYGFPSVKYPPKHELGGEVRLMKWDPHQFRIGVVLLGINELLRKEVVAKIVNAIEKEYHG